MRQIQEVQVGKVVTGMLQMELVMSQLDIVWSAYSKVLMSLVCTEECSSSSLIHIAHPSCPRNACFVVDWRERERHTKVCNGWMMASSTREHSSGRWEVPGTRGFPRRDKTGTSARGKRLVRGQVQSHRQYHIATIIAMSKHSKTAIRRRCSTPSTTVCSPPGSPCCWSLVGNVELPDLMVEAGPANILCQVR